MVSGNAPDLYTVACETSKGPFEISVHRSWAPKGADRFHELVLDKFYDDAPFFRMVEGFVVQFGLNSDPEVTSKWSEKTIQDDPVTESNKVGYLSFAMRSILAPSLAFNHSRSLFLSISRSSSSALALYRMSAAMHTQRDYRGPNTRTTQLFINLVHNKGLDGNCACASAM
jgi:cyclophilin family peptidyl-prolyl cis-trans isomerase